MGIRKMRAEQPELFAFQKNKAAKVDVEPVAVESEPVPEQPKPVLREPEPPTEPEPQILLSVPISVDNDNTVNLDIWDNQAPEDAVADFCGKHMPAAGESCANQLLPRIIQK